LDILQAVGENVLARVRTEVLAWADREQAAAKARRAKRRAEVEEAEDWLIRLVTEDRCVRGPVGGNGRWVYCDECPLGSHIGPMSHGAQRVLCSRRRVYSE
jgi:hypothetical protein